MQLITINSIKMENLGTYAHTVPSRYACRRSTVAVGNPLLKLNEPTDRY